MSTQLYRLQESYSLRGRYLGGTITPLDDDRPAVTDAKSFAESILVEGTRRAPCRLPVKTRVRRILSEARRRCLPVQTAEEFARSILKR